MASPSKSRGRESANLAWLNYEVIEAMTHGLISHYNEKLGLLGQGIFQRISEEWFGARSVEFKGQTKKGADFIVDTTDFKGAFEVKFLIRTGDWPLYRKRTQSLMLNRFSSKPFRGKRKFVVVMGRKPTNWVEISKWCSLKHIQPYFIPFDDVGFLKQVADAIDANPKFDVDPFIEGFSQDFKPRLFLVFSIISEFGRLSDGEWERIRGCFPPDHTTGRPKVQARRLIDGILYRCFTDASFRKIPPEFGSPETIARRLREWVSDETWDKILYVLSDCRKEDLLTQVEARVQQRPSIHASTSGNATLLYQDKAT